MSTVCEAHTKKAQNRQVNIKKESKNEISISSVLIFPPLQFSKLGRYLDHPSYSLFGNPKYFTNHKIMNWIRIHSGHLRKWDATFGFGGWSLLKSHVNLTQAEALHKERRLLIGQNLDVGIHLSLVEIAPKLGKILLQGVKRTIFFESSIISITEKNSKPH